MKITEQMRRQFPALRQKVEETFGRRMETASDFKELSFDIFHKLGEPLSESFLKRFWGYMAAPDHPRETSLSILSRYIGFPSFSAFCRESGSRFFEAGHVSTKDLSPETLVELSWAPDRTLVLRVEEDRSFTVVKSIQSKLHEGDRFQLSGIAVGASLLISGILRDGKTLPPYLAGLNGGISSLKITPSHFVSTPA